MSDPECFPVGKLPQALLAELLERIPCGDRRVLLGPGIGRDAAVIDTGGSRLLVAKTDPITFASDRIGWYAVHVNANDIAVMGATPCWFLATLLLPEAATREQDVRTLFDDIASTCRSLGVSLVGGHTEVTGGLDRPVVVGQMLGEVERERLVRPSGARVGDALVLTKGVAVEGTAILARERAADCGAVLGSEALERARRLLFEPGISVVRDARLAMQKARVRAMHDPTEGGLATALHELARAAGAGIELDRGAVPVLPETEVLCRHFGLDPLGLIASGALLVAVDPGEAAPLVRWLESHGLRAAVVGRLTAPGEGVRLGGEGGLTELPLYEQDELTRVLG